MPVVYRSSDTWFKEDSLGAEDDVLGDSEDGIGSSEDDVMDYLIVLLGEPVPLLIATATERIALVTKRRGLY